MFVVVGGDATVPDLTPHPQRQPLQPAPTTLTPTQPQQQRTPAPSSSPAAVILVRAVKAHPLGAAAEQHAAVVYAQLDRRCVAACRAHEAVDGGACIVLVCVVANGRKGGGGCVGERMRR